jgi:N-acetyl-gamma-glutamyl-phosphate reductase
MHTVTRAGAVATAKDEAAGSPAQTVRVAVAGATGYTGQELLRLLARHPAATLTAAMSSGATSAVRRLPALAHVWSGSITPLSPETLEREADVVFLALPDSAAAELGPRLVAAGVRVVDLSGAFRLRDASERTRWYPETREVPAAVAYGLTERERESVKTARLVANPGCYPTTTLLALAPLVEAGLVPADTDIIVDAKSGVSGAGKTPSERTHFSECHGSLSAYGVFNHRHGAEIEQGVGRTVTFTPHLVPLDRGILSTIYVRVPAGTSESTLADVYANAYAGASFVRLTGDALP